MSLATAQYLGKLFGNLYPVHFHGNEEERKEGSFERVLWPRERDGILPPTFVTGALLRIYYSASTERGAALVQPTSTLTQLPPPPSFEGPSGPREEENENSSFSFPRCCIGRKNRKERSTERTFPPPPPPRSLVRRR